MKKAFDRMAKLRGYVDANFSGRDWNLATAMVIKGEAGMQIMGDWAKGEFLNAGKVPGTDFLCFRFPGTQGTVTFNSDQFGMFKVGDDQQAAQVAAGHGDHGPELPVGLQHGQGLGAGPHRRAGRRTSTPAARRPSPTSRRPTRTARCSARMAHGHASPAAVKNAIYDVVTASLQRRASTPADAVKELR